ncbi:MAG: AAA family ATPase [Maioricimonas sp. JB049]
MISLKIQRETRVSLTSRVRQMCGLFDLEPAKTSRREWSHELPIDEFDWQIGLVYGPSGCGKSTLARELWPDALVDGFEWPADRSVVDAFPADMPIKNVCGLLSSVGFSSPPAWVRPHHVLSNGEQFRATVARALAERPELLVVDEFTSVVDRRVARIGSHAVAKTVRRRGGQFVAVACHDDLIEWLDPDWTYEPAAGQFQRRRERRPRPAIELEVRRVGTDAWRWFAPHHYLSHKIARPAQCFLGLVDGAPAVFTAVMSFPHKVSPSWREHRTVCLPDFQGAGIGMQFSTFVASLYAATGRCYTSTTAHPGLIASRARSPVWDMVRTPQRASVKSRTQLMRQTASQRAHYLSIAVTRATAGFRYCGPANPDAARALGVI